MRALATGDPHRVEAALALGPDLTYRHEGVPLVARVLDMPQIEEAHLPTILAILLEAGAPMDSAPDLRLTQGQLSGYEQLQLRVSQRQDLLSTLLYSRGDDSESLAVLLEHGADPAAQVVPVQGRPYGPVDSAIALSARRCLAMLITYGADPDGASGQSLIDVPYRRDPEGAENARQLVGILLALGADPKRTVKEPPHSCMVHPLINGCLGAAQELAAAGADLEVRLSKPQVGFRAAATPRQMLNYLVRTGDEPGFDGIRPSQVLAASAASKLQQRLEQGTSGVSLAASRKSRL